MNAPFAEFAEQHGDLLFGLAVFSGITFLASLVAVPWMLARIPADYFVRERPQLEEDGSRWFVWLLRKFAKNTIGLVLFLAGLAMLGFPGQGLLTMLIGLSLLDFPGKRTLELKLISRQHVRRTIDWLRARQGKPPLLVTDPDADVSPAASVVTHSDPQQQPQESGSATSA